MKLLFYILLLLLLLVVIFYNDIVIYLSMFIKLLRNKEKFLTENIDPEKDGKMIFNYLTNPTYANSILSRYYISDDTKLAGRRVIDHPYQIPHSPNGRDMYYGTFFYNKSLSDSIYNSTKIRL